MNVVLAGLGSIGQRHLAHLGVRPARVTVWHQHRSRGGPIPDDGRLATAYSLEEALAACPDAVMVTGPASTHVATAIEFARRGIPVFIEKPLAADMDGVDELLATCVENSVVLMVGYCFRFYRPLQALRAAVQSGGIGRVLSVRAEAGQYLPDWRPTRDYRDGVSAHRALGGGALLELSHEMDYVRWIAGEVDAVTARVAQVSDLKLDVEDLADVILDLSSGAVASVHVDLLQRAAHRECRVVGTAGTLVWDRLNHATRLFSASTGEWTDVHPPDPTAFEEMYQDQLAAFLDAAARCAPHQGATGEDGRRALEIIAAARRSSAEGRTVRL